MPTEPYQGQKENAQQIGRKVAKNSIASMGAVGIYFFSRLALTPFILHYVDLAQFGLWSMCFVILSYAGLGAIGVNGAYIKFTAEYQSQNNQHGIASLLSTGIMAMTLFCVIFYTVLYLILPYLLTVFKVSDRLTSTASFMILGTAIAFCLDFTLGGFRSTLEGLQEIALSKSINVSASLFEVAMVVVLLPLGFGIKGLLYAYVIKTFAENAVCTGFVLKKLPGLKLRPRLISKKAFSDLFVFGSKVQVLGALAIFLGSLDRIIVASFLGLKATGMYEVGGKFAFTARNLSAAAFGPLLPAASYIGSRWERGDRIPPGERFRKYLGIVLGSVVIALLPSVVFFREIEEKVMRGTPIPHVLAVVAVLAAVLLFIIKIKRFYRKLNAEDKLIGEDLRDLYLKGFRNINVLNVTLFSFLMAAAHPLIISWVGKEYLAAVPVLVLLSFAFMIHQGTGPAGLLVRGINRAGRELEYLLIQFVLGVIWIPAGTLLFGIKGTAMGIIGSSALGSFFFFWRTNLAFRVSNREMFKTVVVPAAAPAVSAAVMYAITLLIPTMDRWSAAAQVVILGIFHLALSFVILWKFFLYPDEKDTIRRLLARFKRSKRD